MFTFWFGFSIFIIIFGAIACLAFVVDFWNDWGRAKRDDWQLLLLFGTSVVWAWLWPLILVALPLWGAWMAYKNLSRISA